MFKLIIAAFLCISSPAFAGAALNLNHGYDYKGGLLNPSKANPVTGMTATTSANDPHIRVSRQSGVMIKTSTGTIAANAKDLLNISKFPIQHGIKSLIKGGVIAVGAGLLADYLKQLGYEAMAASNDYMVAKNHDLWSHNTSCTGLRSAQMVSCLESRKYAGPNSSNYRYSSILYHGTINPVTATITFIYFDSYYGIDKTGTVKLNQIGSVVEKNPPTDLDLDAASSGFVDNHPLDAVKRVPEVETQPGSTTEIDPQSTPKEVVRESIKTNPDGSTVKEVDKSQNTVEMPKVETKPGMKPNVTETTTTETTTTDKDGNSSTSTETTTKPGEGTNPNPNPQPEPEPEPYPDDYARDDTVKDIADQLKPGDAISLDALAPDPALLDKLKESLPTETQFASPIGRIIDGIGLPVSGGQCSLQRTITIFGKAITLDLMPASLCAPYQAIVTWLFWGLVVLYGWNRVKNFTGARSQ
ncbi:hypothetical protein [Craterilacuibacter sp. RT1T]|uniref:hypothetical protein n=1 Tax=Craterilacuibacter sp. RT1T TaxID=2942211 RepID=UPI0020BE40F0|nr:hypothetical protein [Craterilacuibacter sp. RT1T]MCL6263158.1 hypothetical protein [Craterilacuibacter sp. RT1T]